jgi:hypothetical protein
LLSEKQLQRIAKIKDKWRKPPIIVCKLGKSNFASFEDRKMSSLST